MMVVWYIFYSTVGAAAARACSESTVRSIVKPQHVILLHLLLKTHNKHPLQDALINPKNVIINVLFSDTKSLKSHITIVYVIYFANGETSLFSRAAVLSPELVLAAFLAHLILCHPL